MSARRGIFFNSKARTNEKINQLTTTTATSNEDPISKTNQTGTVKKKIILNHAKRAMNKTIYSGPRKIFSTNYKANRTQLNHKAFFGGDTDEYDIDNNQKTTMNTLHSKTIIHNSTTRTNSQQIPTVVSNFRQPTTCAELDETQSYIDDMEYLLAGFQPGKVLGDRCLSAIKFAELCTKESFRMHIRTENALERIFNLLKDAPDIPSLNICTAFVLYILSSDTLASEMNPDIIHLMLDLIKKSASINIDDHEYKKTKKRILEINSNSLSKDIFYEQKFNARDIILETFVNIARNNLKESLVDVIRTSRGFDLMIDEVYNKVQDLSNYNIESPPLSHGYRKVCRYINMLEEFSNENSEQLSRSHSDVNRMYIAQYKQYSLFHSLSKLLDLSIVWLQKDLPVNESSTTEKNSNIHHVFRDGCKTIMSILVIVTSDCEIICDRLTTDDRFFSNLFRLLVTIEKSSFSNEDKFDTLALTLNLLINLVQNTKDVYKHLMQQNMPGGSSLKIYEYLGKLFCEQESSAARAESHEENDWMMEDVDDKEFDEQSDTVPTNESGATFNRALQKAAGHMENTFVAAFSGVILAVILLRDQATYVSQIRELMPQKKFDTMAFILKKFFVFMQMSHAFTPSGVKILEEIISMVLSLCG
ncbi:unnamed protein product [Rotaria socialis]|uniref:WAPL domain-containing protein n=2 Tax=Rotaria socialis TaxID=392032 RepID=A0A820H3S0_9BILA|nr:unnamed protein product [Rotaria socialis]CAF3401544.1 unnamed protein product [Rotaria socialis]CAF3471978.1 unnamed protein product [Rotaria socialis]CAF3559032.1 unnamed protein product [Rotaria socialis]CAF4288713.1 unnamed protein product [Rotaria socialis]